MPQQRLRLLTQSLKALPPVPRLLMQRQPAQGQPWRLLALQPVMCPAALRLHLPLRRLPTRLHPTLRRLLPRHGRDVRHDADGSAYVLLHHPIRLKRAEPLPAWHLVQAEAQRRWIRHSLTAGRRWHRAEG